MFKQIRAFDTSKAGNVPKACLRNTRLGYEIPAKYDTATEAWNATEQHNDRNIPKGVAVPLYYSYTTTINGVRKNYGHINVQLPDGRVWSDGRYFANLKAYEDWGLPTFLGWGESVNDVKVISEGESEMVMNKEDAIWYWRVVRFKHSPTAAEQKSLIGKEFSKIASAEYETSAFKKRSAAVKEDAQYVPVQAYIKK